MVWDFVETNPIGERGATFQNAIEWVAKVIAEQASAVVNVGQVQQSDARRSPLPDEAADILFSDPPYYDSVPYADLADFFLVWHKQALQPDASGGIHTLGPDGLSPKSDECVLNNAHLVDGVPKSRAFFESCLQQSFVEANRVTSKNGVGCIVFAHKSTEGWEALLKRAYRG